MQVILEGYLSLVISFTWLFTGLSVFSDQCLGHRLNVMSENKCLLNTIAPFKTFIRLRPALDGGHDDDQGHQAGHHWAGPDALPPPPQARDVWHDAPWLRHLHVHALKASSGRSKIETRYFLSMVWLYLIFDQMFLWICCIVSVTCCLRRGCHRQTCAEHLLVKKPSHVINCEKCPSWRHRLTRESEIHSIHLTTNRYFARNSVFILEHTSRSTIHPVHCHHYIKISSNFIVRSSGSEWNFMDISL